MKYFLIIVILFFTEKASSQNLDKKHYIFYLNSSKESYTQIPVESILEQIDFELGILDTVEIKIPEGMLIFSQSDNDTIHFKALLNEKNIKGTFWDTKEKIADYKVMVDPEDFSTIVFTTYHYMPLRIGKWTFSDGKEMEYKFLFKKELQEDEYISKEDDQRLFEEDADAPQK